MARQYFCWKVHLTFGCGCVEYTQTQHVCGASRDGCRSWVTMKQVDKPCEVHRGRSRALNHHHYPSASYSVSASASASSSLSSPVEGGEGLGTYVLLDSAVVEQPEGLLPSQNKMVERKKSQGGVGFGGYDLEGGCELSRAGVEERYWTRCQPCFGDDSAPRAELREEREGMGENKGQVQEQEQGQWQGQGRRRAEEWAQKGASWEGCYLARRRV
ncbi:hypothetical protein MMYC01_203633 [Madurella mycetomatis]|uniref:Uncharacterized protein n=1 Tax=Madurella mycetomatis TaxID=100816 RepID=A0A175WBE8_9PEZI|nr:hypothetical protein MMYC01_203633 [Madurella mycetomatis]